MTTEQAGEAALRIWAECNKEHANLGNPRLCVLDFARRLLAWERERTEPKYCPECNHGNRLNGKLIHAPNCSIGYPPAATTAQDALDARLPYIVEYMRKDGGHGWIPMAAFDQQRIAENYAQSCRGDNIPWEYRVVDAAMRAKEEG